MIVNVASQGRASIALSSAVVKKIATRVLKSERKKISGDLTVIFVDNRVIKRLNRDFHDNNRETDVIAFGYPPSPKGPWADIYVSVPVARTNAKRYHETAEQEVKRLVIHGLLHLLGYDDHRPKDKDIMWKKQETLLTFFKGR